MFVMYADAGTAPTVMYDRPMRFMPVFRGHDCWSKLLALLVTAQGTRSVPLL